MIRETIWGTVISRKDLRTYIIQFDAVWTMLLRIRSPKELRVGDYIGLHHFTISGYVGKEHYIVIDAMNVEICNYGCE